ncbi:DNA repair protein RadA [Vallitalea okinawensis]|uniref:DNA repair protein RadA n=1 Tax=Vallitalea okinawensis TaxID=2078660 RepID=UPI000CFE1A71|nr:DNA repair protein RadA [Vallitalea okinawensis]
MAKTKNIYFCQECGHESPKWMGQCPGCKSWNSFVEETVVKSKNPVSRNNETKRNRPTKINEIKIQEENRVTTGIGELDRVLGGGVVRGGLTLVGGDPGIGKSTLLLQMCEFIGRQNKKVLYASGEESETQIKLRGDRLGITTDNLLLFAETSLESIESVIKEMMPDMVIIDSIQTIYSESITSAPGSVSQVREGTAILMRLAKQLGVSIFIVGHVTKEGAIAGPRVLEHMVDTVLYFEGERHASYRVLRAVKNRFGSTNEIGVFEMRDVGLVEVTNPSEMMLSGRPENEAGSVVTCSIEGTRPMLIEVQALVSPTNFGMPRRTATGTDYNRVVLLMAVLEKKIGMQLVSYDSYVNIAGGIKTTEPALDLGIVAAIASSFRSTPISNKLIACGEVGLTGEVRAVSMVEKRITEAAKMGFEHIIVPKANLKGLNKIEGIHVHGVENVSDALSILWNV